MSKILIVADHANGKLNSGVAKVMAVAQAIGGDVDIVVFSDNAKAVAEQAAKINGTARALTVDNAANANLMGAVLAPQIVELVKGGYTHVLFCGNALGKDTAPRVAALLGVPQVSDIMATDAASTLALPSSATASNEARRTVATMVPSGHSTVVMALPA